MEKAKVAVAAVTAVVMAAAAMAAACGQNVFRGAWKSGLAGDYDYGEWTAVARDSVDGCKCSREQWPRYSGVGSSRGAVRVQLRAIFILMKPTLGA